jgi:hypothetical protein
MKRQPAKTPAAIDLDAGLAGVAVMNVEQLRELWRQKRGQEPPPSEPSRLKLKRTVPLALARLPTTSPRDC